MMSQRVRLRQLNLALLFAFSLIALSLAFWAAWRGRALEARADNPRAVEAALRVQRGRILDSDDIILAQTVGPQDDLERVYPIAAIGPAVGYYSFRYGTAGVESSLDAILRGETADWETLFGRQLLHAPQVGRDVRLTLHAAWQEAATAFLTGERGAILLLSLADGAVRAMASQPGYDPNTLDEAFLTLAEDETGALLNRVTQGQFQPGLALAPFVAAALVEAGEAELSDVVADANSPVVVDGVVWRCTEAPPADATFGDATLGDALHSGCPAPLVAGAGALSAEAWADAFSRYGLADEPDLPLTLAPAEEVRVSVPADAVLGQDALLVSPLQLGLSWLALLNQGSLVQPRLVSAVQGEDGAWQTYTRIRSPRQAMPANVAAAVAATLPREGEIVELAAPAIAGAGEASEGSGRLAWYLGATPASAPQFVVVVVVENSSDLASARDAGRALLQLVFNAQP